MMRKLGIVSALQFGPQLALPTATFSNVMVEALPVTARRASKLAAAAVEFGWGLDVVATMSSP